MSTRRKQFFYPNQTSWPVIGLATGEGGGANAFSPFKAELDADARDLNIICIGDSTSCTVFQFLYLWYAQIAAQYPKYSFEYYPSNAPTPPVTDGGYGTKVDVSIGTGTHKVRLYNNSIPGELAMFPLGSFFNTAFPVTPDLVIWNMGKNHVAGFSSNPNNYPVTAGEFWGAYAQIQDAFPNAQQVQIRQYPNRDDSAVVALEAALAMIRPGYPELLMIDFYNLPYVFGDYLDGIHLTNSANSTILLPKFMSVWNAAPAAAFSPAAPFMSTKVRNWLDDDAVNYGTRSGVYGDFNNAANGATLPVDWFANGSPVFANETTTVVAPRTKALSINGSGVSGPRINNFVTAAGRAALAGKQILMVAQRYNDIGADPTVGIMSLSITSPTVNGGAAVIRTVQAKAKGNGGYRYLVIGPVDVPADVSSMSVTIYHDSDTTPDTEPVYWQKVIIVQDKVPRDTL